MTKWNKIGSDLDITGGRPASDREMHKAFLEANGLTEWAYFSHGWDDLQYILTHGRFPPARRKRPDDGFPCPPYIDHARLYRGRGLPVLAYHPYLLADEIRPQVAEWGKEHQLIGRVFDSDKSWYYPGSTALVIITAPDTEVRL